MKVINPRSLVRPTEKLSLYIPPAWTPILSRMAERDFTSVNAIIRRAINKAIEADIAEYGAVTDEHHTETAA